MRSSVSYFICFPKLDTGDRLGGFEWVKPNGAKTFALMYQAFSLFAANVGREVCLRASCK
jgi:hypothetical protein